MQNLFSQQVSPEIVDELISNKSEMGGKKRYVCVLFLDIRGFTPFCQDRTPEEIVQYQNDVFSFMIEIISTKQGIINQFLGDGFMATFGAPLSQGHDCQNAVEAAILINDEVDKRSQNGQIPATKIGIGIHAGEAVTGNVGTKNRQQYSITGNVVILASRLEQLNKKLKTRILISKEVLDEINSETIPHEWIGPVDIKGMGMPLEVVKIV
jgi:adenylate cyclase